MQRLYLRRVCQSGGLLEKSSTYGRSIALMKVSDPKVQKISLKRTVNRNKWRMWHWCSLVLRMTCSKISSYVSNPTKFLWS
jgi:hypothetical protein